jgi:glycerophosphoryl diester phosphodiesterase
VTQTAEGMRRLLARPIAHRGLHDAAKGVAENSLGAARAAIARDYAIECDVRLSADGEAMVFHDEELDRLTAAAGPLADRTARELSALALGGSSDTILTLKSLLDAVSGRVALVVEIKSRFDGDLRLAHRVGALAADYLGPIALKSFDPDPIAFLRANAKNLNLGATPLGIVAEAHYGEDHWPELSRAQRVELTHFLHYERTSPEFLSFNIEAYPHAAPALFRQALKLPVVGWTARTPDAAAAALKWADQIVFEGFSP